MLSERNSNKGCEGEHFWSTMDIDSCRDRQNLPLPKGALRNLWTMRCFRVAAKMPVLPRRLFVNRLDKRCRGSRCQKTRSCSLSAIHWSMLQPVDPSSATKTSTLTFSESGDVLRSSVGRHHWDS